MKTYVVNVPDKAENIVLKFFRKFYIKSKEMSDAEYEKRVMLELIKESDNSEDVPEEEVRKYFRKHGVEL